MWLYTFWTFYLWEGYTFSTYPCHAIHFLSMNNEDKCRQWVHLIAKRNENIIDYEQPCLKAKLLYLHLIFVIKPLKAMRMYSFISYVWAHLVGFERNLLIHIVSSCQHQHRQQTCFVQFCIKEMCCWRRMFIFLYIYKIVLIFLKLDLL